MRGLAPYLLTVPRRTCRDSALPLTRDASHARGSCAVDLSEDAAAAQEGLLLGRAAAEVLDFHRLSGDALTLGAIELDAQLAEFRAAYCGGAEQAVQDEVGGDSAQLPPLDGSSEAQAAIDKMRLVLERTRESFAYLAESQRSSERSTG